MKYYLVTILLLLSFICYAQDDFRIAHREIITIDSIKNEISYLHFKINTYPEFNYSILTDVNYTVKYQEFGTPEEFTWVKLFDGHLVNDLHHEYNSQWKGPFPGNRDILYQFYFELIRDSIENNNNKLQTTILSTNPELDYNYCNLNYKAPFDITAFYYNTENIKLVLDIYSNCSTVYTAYSVIVKGSNPVVAAASTIVEGLVIYAIKASLDKFPIYLTITCNTCGYKETIEIESLNYNNIYKCPTFGCHNMAEIRLIK
jgi:hypothetical protein